MRKRLFIAIKIPEEIKKKIIEIQQKFKEKFQASWAKIGNIHLTLIFLGEIGIQDIPEVIRIMEASKIPHFDIEFSNLGGFPRLEYCHTLWIGVRQSKKLADLYRRLTDNFRKMGIPIEEKYVPHLTIARFGRKVDLLGKIDLERFKQIKIGQMTVKEIILFESELSFNGAKHYVLRNIKLS